MTLMAVGTNGRRGIALREGFRVYALSVGKEGAIADTGSLHYCLVAVTTAAGFSNVIAVDS